MLAFDRHVCLTRVKPLDVRGERNDLDPVEELVRGVITDDDGGALLSDLAADRRLEVDPPDLTAFHVRRPRWWLLPTHELLLREPRRPPFRDRPPRGPGRQREGGPGIR